MIPVGVCSREELHTAGLTRAAPRPAPHPRAWPGRSGGSGGAWGGRRGREAIPGLAQRPGPARQAARGRRRSQKEGLCRRPALGPAARRQGLRGETPLGPPPAWTPPLYAGAAADTAPGGHHREAGTAGHRRGSVAGAEAERPGRTRGARVRVGTWGNSGDRFLHFAHSGISVSHTPACVSNYPI